MLRRIANVIFGILIALAVGLAVFIATGGPINFDFYFWQTPAPYQTPIFLTKGTTTDAGLTASLNPPVGIMIENELEARPWQKGLSEASIVYEAPTEGRITRFLAIFPFDNLPEKLGPIRSARTYFLDWMSEYKGIYMHVGGNPDVLTRLLREKNVFNADQFVYGTYFRREHVGQTALEHTMFTRQEWIKKLIEDKKLTWSPPEYLSHFPIKKDYSLYPQASKIAIDFGFSTYRIAYEYDVATKKYLRLQAKKPHMDSQNGKQIAAGTVVIQSVKSWPNGDQEGSISIKTIGEGNAFIFKEGRAIKATWKKDLLDGPTRLFDSTSTEEIFLNDSVYSPIWFEIVPTDNIFSYE